MIFQTNDDSIFDSQGYRYNVGIILLNNNNQVFWAKRLGQEAWQFPQGGMKAGEDSLDCMFRELFEEVGLNKQQVEVLAYTKKWLCYRLPMRYRRRKKTSHIQCIGQKQRWYLLRIKVDESLINLASTAHPEFDNWKWLDYWQPEKEVVHFKREVYHSALTEFAPLIFDNEQLAVSN